MEWIITYPATTADAAQIAQFQVDMAMESEGLELNKDIVFRGVCMAMEDSVAKGRYYIAKTSEAIKLEDGGSIPGDTIVGSLFVTREWSDWHGQWYWWVQSVYVRPECRHMGAYRALYTKVCEDAQKACIKEVRLYVDRNNIGAQQTYQKLGMSESHYLLYEQNL